MAQNQSVEKTIAVIGSGQMGRGIAQVASESGYQVLLMDQRLDLAESGLKTISAQLQARVAKGKLDESTMKSTLERMRPVGSFKDCASAALVIEAAPESLVVKTELFSALDAVCAQDTLFASNTSSISITVLAAGTRRPDRFAGMHFMNPVPVMKLVEGIRGLQTSDATFSVIKSVAESMGKTFVESTDAPGFIVNRILMPMINEAVTALQEGVATPTDIDQAMKLGTNQPMGPLELADFIGLDTCLAIMNVLHEGLGDSKYRASPLLKKYVAAGWLGRKSGRGFFNYGK